jgi:NAD(P)-dependent dehydrogenase (short-subunit alcohol dehydrogenase family)
MTKIPMKDKVCIVTGAASGMGRIAARELAKMGATVVMNDREIEEGQAARDDIILLSGNRNVEFIGCDMSSFTEVRKFAEYVLNNYPAIHVLINNAGLTDPEYILSPDGHEQHMAIMHYGHFLLTHLLLERLKKSAPARVIQITSEAHKTGTGMDFDDMTCEKVWKGKRYDHGAAFTAYHRAKLAMVYVTHGFAERLQGSGVTINLVSPGYFVGTNIFRYMRGLMKVGVRIFRPIFVDPERSATTFVYLASSPDVEGMNGKYWEYCKQKETSSPSHDKDMQKRVWDLSMETVGLS